MPETALGPDVKDFKLISGAGRLSLTSFMLSGEAMETSFHSSTSAIALKDFMPCNTGKRLVCRHVDRDANDHRRWDDFIFDFELEVV